MTGLFLEKSNDCIARSRALLVASRAILEESEQICAALRCLASPGRQRSSPTFDSELRQIKMEQIRMKRECSARARQLADGFWSSEDRDRALKYAEELETQAEKLTRALAAPP